MLQRRPITSYVWLALCGVAASLIFYFGFAARYNLIVVGYRPRQSIGTLNQYSNEGALLYIVTFAALFAIYWLGYRIVKSTSLRGLLILIVGFSVMFNFILLWMYPTDASDIYDYIIRGRMSSIYGLNPLQDVPKQVQYDDFYMFISWRNVPSAYGPIWEGLARLASRLAGNDRTTNVITFKLLTIGGYGLAALFVGITLIKIAPHRLLSGLYLFLWNPLLLFMTAGTGHNDALTAACIALAIYSLIRRWYVAATLALVLGALIKFIPLMLVPIVVIIALRQLRGWRRFRYLILSLCLSIVLTVVAYAPYWHGLETLRLERRDRMYTGSVATVIRELLVTPLDGKPIDANPAGTPVTNALLADGTIILFGLFYLWQLAKLLRNTHHDDLLPIRVVGRVILFYLMVVSLWFFGWYVIWLLPVIVLLEDTPLRRLTLRFSYLVTWQSLLYNYLSVSTKGGAWLPWLDLAPVAIFMGYAWGYVIWYQVAHWLRRHQTNPFNLLVGGELRQARIAVGLSVNALSDELDVGCDVVEEYESGERALPLDHAQRLAQELGLSMMDWLVPKP